MQIGRSGGVVTIEGGMLVNGKVEAISQNASATALRFSSENVLPLSQVSLPGIRNTGTIEARANGEEAGTAIAVEIESQSDIPILRNTGTINAATANADSSAIAVVDRSGSLELIENTGSIRAAGAASATDRNVAIDLSANATGAAVKQLAVGANTNAPSIIGDIRFGSGDDVLEIADGSIAANVAFAGGEDRMDVSGDATYSGAVNFGGQAGALSLDDTARFAGRLQASQNVDVTLEGGTLDITGAASIASLEMAEDTVLVATLAGETADTTRIQVGGTAEIEDDAKLRMRVGDLATAVGSYDILTAGSLVGGSNLTAEDVLLPFLFESDVTTTNTKVTVEIERKDASDLGLNRSGTQAFDALYKALEDEDEIAEIFLAADNSDELGALVSQTLPDHAGGSFEAISRGTRLLNRSFVDPRSPFESEAGMRLISDVVYFDSSKDIEETADIEMDGYAVRGGIEFLTGLGGLGITTSYISAEHETGNGSDVSSESFEIGAHWQHRLGPVTAFARGAYGWADFEGTRLFTSGSGDDRIADEFGRDWSGDYLSLAGGVAVEGGSQFLFFRPSITFDYLDLSEDAYTEIGDREPLALTVEERSSDQVGMNLGLAVGADLFGMQRRDDFWLRLEAEGGWREIVAGSLGKTTARFGDSEDSFTLSPTRNDGGWFARLRALAGNGGYLIGGEIGAEEQLGEVGMNVRATLKINW